jgi:signal transduction histidine kinase
MTVGARAGTSGRRTLALVLGIALPTALLGAGWVAASLGERASLERERVALLARTADAVRGAIDESLEELRAREDSRAFYLYNAVFSPPDVVAVSDPIAASPLAGDPDDRRIVGYFQVEPGGTVRTPYASEPGREESERGLRVASLARAEAFAELRAIPARGEVAVASAGDARPPSSSGGLLDWLAPLRRAGAGPAEPAPPSRPSRPRHPSSPPRAAAPPPRDAGPADLAPQGPLTVALNPWGNRVYNDIVEAQAGDPEANLRVQQRGRSAPVTRRHTVPWESMQQESSPRPEAPDGGGVAQARPPRRQVEPPSGDLPSAPSPEPPAEVEVDYTPMAWRRVGEDLVLHRLVSHERTSVLQGVVLDRRYLMEEWIPSLVARHAVAGVAPVVVEASQGTACEVRRPASAVLDDVELCFTLEALGEADRTLRDDLRLRLGALAGLLLVVTLAAVFMHRAARRAEELSAQKSAFVSAVSHELRTPLTTIRMHAEMLRDGLVPEDRRERFHGQLVQESVRLSCLVENVLELSRLEEGRRVLDLREGDLRGHVARVAEEQRAVVAARGFELVGPGSEGEVVARFDGPAISQIVVNLVDNAVKYGAGAEPRTVEVGVELLGTDAAIRVLDRGPGIPAAERERVFERFYRVRGPGSGQVPGTGIGLALVRELAHAHGGEARAMAREGGGCEVRVSIPALSAPGR